MVRPGSGRFGVFEILIHFDVLLFVLLFVLYTLVLFKVGIVDKNRFAHPQASCVVVSQGGGLCIHRREAAGVSGSATSTVYTIMAIKLRVEAQHNIGGQLAWS